MRLTLPPYLRNQLDAQLNTMFGPLGGVDFEKLSPIQRALSDMAEVHEEGLVTFFAAVAFLSSGKWELAEKYLKLARERPCVIPALGPEIEYALFQVLAAQVYMEKKDERLPDTILAAKRRVAMGPLRPQQAEYVLKFLRTVGQLQTAEEMLAATCPAHPDDQKLAQGLCEVSIENGNLGNARRYVEDFSQRWPDHENLAGWNAQLAAPEPETAPQEDLDSQKDLDESRP